MSLRLTPTSPLGGSPLLALLLALLLFPRGCAALPVHRECGHHGHDGNRASGPLLVARGAGSPCALRAEARAALDLAESTARGARVLLVARRDSRARCAHSCCLHGDACHVAVFVSLRGPRQPNCLLVSCPLLSSCVRARVGERFTLFSSRGHDGDHHKLRYLAQGQDAGTNASPAPGADAGRTSGTAVRATAGPVATTATHTATAAAAATHTATDAATTHTATAALALLARSSRQSSTDDGPLVDPHSSTTRSLERSPTARSPQCSFAFAYFFTRPATPPGTTRRHREKRREVKWEEGWTMTMG
ncbi:unnamed protein product [Lampetra fluviatilis]